MVQLCGLVRMISKSSTISTLQTTLKIGCFARNSIVNLPADIRLRCYSGFPPKKYNRKSFVFFHCICGYFQLLSVHVPLYFHEEHFGHFMKQFLQGFLKTSKTSLIEIAHMMNDAF